MYQRHIFPHEEGHLDFYTYGAEEIGVNDRSNYSQYLAHNSQNYQNHKSLDLV